MDVWERARQHEEEYVDAMTTNESVLVLTVGTGTAGKESNVANGLIQAVRATAPSHYYLVPSASPDSLAVAEIVEMGCRAVTPLATFSPESPFFRLQDPDDICGCTESLRGFLSAIRERHPGARLVVNPTSGTKQMTAAAVLAALDCQVEELQFVGGPRLDGVVRTGQEQLRPFSPRAFLAQRARGEVHALIRGGGYGFAVALAGRYLPELETEHALAETLGHWDRIRYADAHKSAARLPKPLAATLRQTLGMLMQGNAAQPIARLADLAAGAERWLALDRPEETVVRLYRLLEMAGKARLTHYGMTEPYTLEMLPSNLPRSLRESLRPRTGQKRLLLGFRDVCDILASLGDDFGKEVRTDPDVEDLAELRNNSVYGHGTRGVTTARMRRLAQSVLSLVCRYYPDMKEWIERCRFPDPESCITPQAKEVRAP
jgi:CRISPR-associated protein (TIGR02710 family)